MILALIGLLTLYGAYYFSTQATFNNENLKKVCLVIGMALLLVDVYTNVVLSSQINNFYNNGAGTTIGNTTIFNSNSTEVAYYYAMISNEVYYVEQMKTYAIYLVPLFILFMFYRYIVEFNAQGKKVKGDE